MTPGTPAPASSTTDRDGSGAGDAAGPRPQAETSSESLAPGSPDRLDDEEGAAPHGPGSPGDTSARRNRWRYSPRAVLAVAGLAVFAIGAAALGWHRLASAWRKPAESTAARMSDKPAAASLAPRPLDLSPLPSPAGPPAAGAAQPAAQVPALLSAPADAVEPIPVHATQAGPGAARRSPPPSPEDAPALLVTTRHPPSNRLSEAGPGAAGHEDALSADAAQRLAATSRQLEVYQRQLQGMLDALPQSASAPLMAAAAPAEPGRAGGLFGEAHGASATPRAVAGWLASRSLTLPKGSAFTCALKTRVITAVSGLVGCLIQRPVYGDDGRVLLIERGSHLDGEYRVVSVRPGLVRIPVLWTRLRTPLGVTVDLDSPATGPLGESGLEGEVDNRWSSRLGAALLLSLIDDSVKLVIQHQSAERGADTVVLPATTANGPRLAEKVLDSTINIPPLITQNQGGIVGIYVARDLDFSTVYELQVTPP